jgi:hypothetical protein
MLCFVKGGTLRGKEGYGTSQRSRHDTRSAAVLRYSRYPLSSRSLANYDVSAANVPPIQPEYTTVPVLGHGRAWVTDCTLRNARKQTGI